MRFITVSTRPLDDDSDLSIRRQPSMLRESCAKYGILLENIGLGAEHAWTGIPRRRILRQYLDGIPYNECVVFTDAWDSFFASNGWAIATEFHAFNKPIVFSAEINLYPDEMAWYVTYPPSPTRFAYVNGGGFAGAAGALRRMLDAPDFWQPPCNCDQWAFGDWAIKHPELVAIDYRCQLFQTLYHEQEKHAPPDVVSQLSIINGRLYNAETGSYPLIVHGNGGRAIEALELWRTLK